MAQIPALLSALAPLFAQPAHQNRMGMPTTGPRPIPAPPRAPQVQAAKPPVISPPTLGATTAGLDEDVVDYKAAQQRADDALKAVTNAYQQFTPTQLPAPPQETPVPPEDPRQAKGENIATLAEALVGLFGGKSVGGVMGQTLGNQTSEKQRLTDEAQAKNDAEFARREKAYQLQAQAETARQNSQINLLRAQETVANNLQTSADKSKALYVKQHGQDVRLAILGYQTQNVAALAARRIDADFQKIAIARGNAQSLNQYRVDEISERYSRERAMLRAAGLRDDTAYKIAGIRAYVSAANAIYSGQVRLSGQKMTAAERAQQMASAAAAQTLRGLDAEANRLTTLLGNPDKRVQLQAAQNLDALYKSKAYTQAAAKLRAIGADPSALYHDIYDEASKVQIDAQGDPVANQPLYGAGVPTMPNISFSPTFIAGTGGTAQAGNTNDAPHVSTANRAGTSNGSVDALLGGNTHASAAGGGNPYVSAIQQNFEAARKAGPVTAQTFKQIDDYLKTHDKTGHWAQLPGKERQRLLLQGAAGGGSQTAARPQ